jgi:hypothetical protein
MYEQVKVLALARAALLMALKARVSCCRGSTALSQAAGKINGGKS